MLTLARDGNSGDLNPHREAAAPDLQEPLPVSSQGCFPSDSHRNPVVLFWNFPHTPQLLYTLPGEVPCCFHVLEGDSMPCGPDSVISEKLGKE